MLNDAKDKAVKRPGEYRSLDAWRGLAALSVAIYHSTLVVFKKYPAVAAQPEYAPCLFGWLGVQVFFVISGYCIANAACKGVERGDSVIPFVRARLRRIFPAYWCALGMSIAVAFVLERLVESGRIASSVTVTDAVIHKGVWCLLANATLTHVPFHQDSFMAQSWTLCYEIAFYGIAAVAAIAMPILKSTRRYLDALHALTAVTVVLLILNPDWLSFPLDLWPEFGLGILVYDVLRNKRAAAPKVWFALCGLLMIGFIVRQSVPIGALAEPSRLSYAFTLGAAILLALLGSFDDTIMRSKLVRLLAAVGVYSYSLYLTHFFSIGLMSQAASYAHLSEPYSAPLLVLATVGAVVFAKVFHRFCERPFLKSASRAPSNEIATAAVASSEARSVSKSSNRIATTHNDIDSNGSRRADSAVHRNPRTILYVDHTAKISGGEVALFNLVRSIDRTQYTPVVVLASEGPLADRLRNAGIETHVIPLDKNVLDVRKDTVGLLSLLRFRQLASTVTYAFRLAGWAKRRRVDLMHTNSLKADIYGALAGRIAGIPVLWHVRDNIDGEYLQARTAAMFRLLARWLPDYVVANSASTLSRLELGANKKGTVVYSGVSNVALLHAQAVHDGYNPADVSEIWTGPDADETVEPSSGRNVDLTFILVGRIASWKGQHVFIRAAADVHARYPRAKFLIVGAALFGEDEYEAQIRKLVRELALEDCVEFLGFRDDVPDLISRSDVLVHASTLGEPFGQVVVEGMAAGKPVIATNGGGLPEIVVTGETGLLVPMGDATAMADAMCLLAGDAKLRAKMGMAGTKRVAERFTIYHTARKIESVYSHMLSGRNGGGGGETIAAVPDTGEKTAIGSESV
jgi:peptidoglycan/LPS O-acetylase OafA/YrhL/glycosyltransferase involved in cell wall biosynthesis